MIVGEIIESYLRENGYDGLYNWVGECGCSVDDLAPCGHCDVDTCEPAYRVSPPEGEVADEEWYSRIKPTEAGK